MPGARNTLFHSNWGESIKDIPYKKDIFHSLPMSLSVDPLPKKDIP